MCEPRIEHFLEKIRRKEYNQAVDYLVGFGLPIVLPLIGLTAVNSYKDIGDPPPVAVFYYASQVMERLGKPCLPIIISQLNSVAYPDRLVAVAFLGQLGYVEALPFVTKTLNDKHDLVRKEAQGAAENIRKRNPGS